MNFKNFSIIAVTGILLIITASGSSIYPYNTDTGLLSFMSRSNDLLQQDPARSLECFNYYIPLIQELARQYELNYKACLNASEIDRANADNATLEQRNDLSNAAKASCDLLNQCNNNDSVQGIFECYINGGSENIKTMYSINANASEELANLKEQYYLIENKENRCTNETKRAYEKESAEAYENLNNCILGKLDIPTEAPSTEAPSTTKAPSSTEVPSSTESSSSEVPPTSTEAPSTASTVTEPSPTETIPTENIDQDYYY